MYSVACVCGLFIEFIGLFCVCCSVMFVFCLCSVCGLCVVCCVAVCCFAGLSCVYVSLLSFVFPLLVLFVMV